MHPDVHATTRTPGPSTVAPVVKECTNPMSPVTRAIRTSGSDTSRPRWTRSSNGLFAAIGLSTRMSGMAAASMKRPIDDVHLLVARQADEVHGVTRDPNGQARIFLGMVHRVDQGVAVQHVDVHVVARAGEESVEH